MTLIEQIKDYIEHLRFQYYTHKCMKGARERKKRFDELAQSGQLETLCLSRIYKIIGIKEDLTEKDIKQEFFCAYRVKIEFARAFRN